MQGRAAAALMSPPADRQLLKEGYKRLIYVGDVFKNVPFSAMLTTAKIIQEEPDLVQRGVTAVTKALLFIRENRDGGIEMIMRHGQVDKELATSLYDLMRDAYSTELTPEGVMQRAELGDRDVEGAAELRPESIYGRPVSQDGAADFGAMKA